jgi:hypothetical protein
MDWQRNLVMRVLKTFALAGAMATIGASVALACPMGATADSGQIVIATAPPQPVTPQTPVLLPLEID